MKTEQKKSKLIALAIVGSIIAVGSLFYSIYALIISPNSAHIEEQHLEGKQYESGFIVDEGYELVIQNCTGCHSSKLVTDNKATYKGWKENIRWMQQTQNLWDLGENEHAILSYLAKNYGTEDRSGRKPLTNIEWYVLEPED